MEYIRIANEGDLLTVYKEIIFQLHILRNRMRHMPTDKAGARSRTLLGIRSHCNEKNKRGRSTTT